MTIAISDIGVQLRRRPGGSEDTIQYDVAVDITGLPALGSDPDTIEVTRLVSETKEYILGRQGQERYAFPYNYTKENYMKVKEWADNKTVSDFLLELPDGSGFTFTGTASTHLDAPDGAMRAQLTIAPSNLDFVEDVSTLIASG